MINHTAVWQYYQALIKLHVSYSRYFSDINVFHKIVATHLKCPEPLMVDFFQVFSLWKLFDIWPSYSERKSVLLFWLILQYHINKTWMV